MKILTKEQDSAMRKRAEELLGEAADLLGPEEYNNSETSPLVDLILNSMGSSRHDPAFKEILAWKIAGRSVAKHADDYAEALYLARNER